MAAGEWPLKEPSLANRPSALNRRFWLAIQPTRADLNAAFMLPFRQQLLGDGKVLRIGARAMAFPWRKSELKGKYSAQE
jgi:hypothetical protein